MAYLVTKSLLRAGVYQHNDAHLHEFLWLMRRQLLDDIAWLDCGSDQNLHRHLADNGSRRNHVERT